MGGIFIIDNDTLYKTKQKKEKFYHSLISIYLSKRQMHKNNTDRHRQQSQYAELRLNHLK